MSQKTAFIGCFWTVMTLLNILLLPGRYAVRVPVETIQKTPLPQVVRAGGTVEPRRSVSLKAEFEGPVIEKLYKEGDRVTKGQLLLEIGRNKVRLEHEGKVITLENARSDLAKARKDVKITRALFDKGAVAQSAVEDALHAAVRAAQALKTAGEDFQQQEEKWNKNKLYAAFDGTILKDGVGNESAVTAGMELAILADISEYAVVAKVDELEIRQIRPGQKAEVRLQAYDGISVPARVSDIGSQAEANGLTEVPVTLILENVPGLVLRPKLSAMVHITTGKYGQVLSVPLTALSNADGETRVWVVERLNRLRSQRVLIGQSNPDRAEIKQGLKEGQRICAVATPRLASGMKVIPEKKRPAPAPKRTND